mmetsp:Transcript_18237/g.68996  ORF Transcript_18237/g.68996 Transcript_18237/m.68996 type:complete len:280 (+) Transcript_18237:391-1230(+)
MPRTSSSSGRAHSTAMSFPNRRPWSGGPHTRGASGFLAPAAACHASVAAGARAPLLLAARTAQSPSGPVKRSGTIAPALSATASAAIVARAECARPETAASRSAASASRATARLAALLARHSRRARPAPAPAPAPAAAARRRAAVGARGMPAALPGPRTESAAAGARRSEAEAAAEAVRGQARRRPPRRPLLQRSRRMRPQPPRTWAPPPVSAARRPPRPPPPRCRRRPRSGLAAAGAPRPSRAAPPARCACLWATARPRQWQRSARDCSPSTWQGARP